MKTRSLALGLTAAAALLAGCASQMMADKPVAIVKDGELAMPAGYKSWPSFLPAVQRADAKQVREIYMNPVAAKGSADKGFPNGSLFVMENYAAQANSDGSLKKDADGKLIKGELLRVFVMGKNAGWGQDVPDNLKNGNWVYSSYLATGAKGPEKTETCRACHAPLTQSKDFVHRYDEHFGQKKAALSHTDVKTALGSGAAPSAGELQGLASLSR